MSFKITTVSVFAVVTLLSVGLAGGYKVPARQSDTLKGSLLSSVIIIAVYSILPLELRFSRAVILWGIFSSVAIIPVFRLFIALSGSGLVKNPFIKARRILIVGEKDGFGNVKSILCQKDDFNLLGRVSLLDVDSDPEVLGNLNQISDVIRINNANEIIFSTSEMTISQIINSMYLFANSNVTIKIAPPGEGVIIGSKSVEFIKDIYSVEAPVKDLIDILP